MSNVPEFIKEDLMVMGSSKLRLSYLISELYDKIVLDSDDAVGKYLRNEISQEECTKASELMNEKLEWLEANLYNLQTILEDIENSN